MKEPVVTFEIQTVNQAQRARRMRAALRSAYIIIVMAAFVLPNPVAAALAHVL